MRKLKLYIETSTWNFVFAQDSPEKMALTKQFFDLAGKGVYEILISDVVLAEIQRAPREIRDQLTGLINKFAPVELQITQEAERLAQVYIERKIIPEKKIEDALHVAVATVEEVDAVVTWNYQHLANIRKAELFYSANLEMGYHKRIEIITPLEVIGYDEI